MIFPHAIIEPVLQVDDKTRIDCRRSFVSKDEEAVTVFEVEPDTGFGFISLGLVTKEWYLDWQYPTDGEKTITVRITTDGAPTSATFTIDVLSAEDDNLFSNDLFLIRHESDIMNYLRPGRNSWLNFHRQAQEKIMAELDESGFSNTDGTKLTKEAIIDKDEVRQWSGYLALSLIFADLSRDPEDSFRTKSNDYLGKSRSASDRMHLRIDTNKDGVVDRFEGLSIKTVGLIRI